MHVIYLFAALVVALAGQIYDDVMTETGLKAKVAIEGNSWLVGSNPTAVKLYLRDSTVVAVTLVPSILAYHFGSAPFFYAGLTAPVVAGIKHLLGGLAWRKLLTKQ